MSAGPRPRGLVLRDLGRREYGATLDLQRRLAEERAASKGEDTLLVVEHEEVVTLGRSAQRTSRDRAAEVALATAAGIPVFEIERGGSATYHGPGQLVGYPIVRLEEGERDVHAFLRTLEGSLADALLEVVGITAVGGGPGREPTGLWVEGRKIASIGIAVRRWVTYHGFALNVATDLSRFALIRPCDLEPAVMTSLRELGQEVDRVGLVSAVHRTLAKRLGRRARG